jgi:hypothetical protein
MHGKGIRNNCFTVLICFYSPRGNNGSIDTFVGFNGIKRMLLLKQALMPDANGSFKLAYSNSDLEFS